MNNTQEQTSYSKPDFWNGDDASFTLCVKQAATEIKHLMKTPFSLLGEAGSLALFSKIVEAKQLKCTLPGTGQRTVRLPVNHST